MAGHGLREDDTAIAGMPEERPVATPPGGFGNIPGHNEPEPSEGAAATALPRRCLRSRANAPGP